MKSIYILLVSLIFTMNYSYAQKSTTVIKSNATVVSFSADTKPLKVYPNPATNYVQIDGLKEAEDYILYDGFGNKINIGSISSEDKINVEKLKKGIYFFVVDKKYKLIFFKE